MDHKTFYVGLVSIYERSSTQEPPIMHTSDIAREALGAYQSGSRTRRASRLGDHLCDAFMAAGGILVANSLLPLGFNLPAGQIGLSLGGALLAGSFAWMRRHGHRRQDFKTRQPITAHATANVVHLDAWKGRQAA